MDDLCRVCHVLDLAVYHSHHGHWNLPRTITLSPSLLFAMSPLSIALLLRFSLCPRSHAGTTVTLFSLSIFSNHSVVDVRGLLRLLRLRLELQVR